MADVSKTHLARTSRVIAITITVLFSLVVIASSHQTRAAQSEARRAKTPGEAAASYFPNNLLINQDNRSIHFFDDLLRGKTVLINFMFTTCTGICPTMTANLQKVQGLLGDRVGKDINMISVSVDPLTDTPDALKKYTTKFNVKPGWQFLTGNKADVDQVLRKIGGFVEDKNQHNSILMIGNVESGEWVKMMAMAKPSEIVENVLKIATPKKN